MHNCSKSLVAGTCALLGMSNIGLAASGDPPPECSAAISYEGATHTANDYWQLKFEISVLDTKRSRGRFEFSFTTGSGQSDSKNKTWEFTDQDTGQVLEDVKTASDDNIASVDVDQDKTQCSDFSGE